MVRPVIHYLDTQVMVWLCEGQVGRLSKAAVVGIEESDLVEYVLPGFAGCQSHPQALEAAQAARNAGQHECQGERGCAAPPCSQRFPPALVWVR